ncbi:MAG: hypothetical protein AAGE59_27400 [Cyanobacteria bacterium P01_F01_bin.86]
MRQNLNSGRIVELIVGGDSGDEFNQPWVMEGYTIEPEAIPALRTSTY